ncbi:MAG TPA: hypothetical protein PKN56_09415 [Leptospiraceae bacterium]|nr:hypothetical protein [Leptospiraceae bacterium]
MASPFNIRRSIVLTIAFGTAFTIVLALTPMKKKRGKTAPVSERAVKSASSVPVYRLQPFFPASPDSQRAEREYFRIYPVLYRKESELRIIFQGAYTPDSERNFEIRNLFWRNDSLLNSSSNPYTYYKDNDITFSAVTDSESRFLHKEIAGQKQYGMYHPVPRLEADLKLLELSYRLSANVTANVRSGANDNYGDDRFQILPTTMAGLSFGNNKIVSAGFMTGESRTANYYTNNVNMASPAQYLAREDQMLTKDTDRRNMFELHTNIAPTKNIQFQTGVYNSNRAILNEGASEGARVAMQVGFRYLIFNLKYNFSSDNMMKSGFRADPSLNAKDYGGVGLTFFLDASRRYSLYLGNNFYNLMVPVRYSDGTGREAQPTSFAASFRGKSPLSNGTFFLNFRNQYNKDQLYSNFGLFRVPIYSQINLDYATSLGLELSF